MRYDADGAAHQRFVAAARSFWRGPLFRELYREAQSAPEAMPSLVTYQYFAWLERHLQRMKYSGPRGLVASAQRQRDALLAQVAEPLPPHLLSLDPSLEAPGYWADHDIHQQPGGLVDDLGAFVYREAVGGGVVGTPGLHERFATRVVADRRVERVLDLGCGFGRSTVAFAHAAGNARVEGVDLSASCVTLAAHEAPEAMRERLAFRQADAVASGAPDAAYDVVTSTMLLHEMPEPAVRALIAESARVLRPGGIVAHLDFVPPSDPVLRVLFEGHARRNNEPFLLEHSRIDLARAYADAGFRRVDVVPFDEEDDALAAPPRAWRLPWHMIVAEKGTSAPDRPRREPVPQRAARRVVR